ncbi:MAG: PDZ domain-containing protein [Sphingomonas sp.]|nr:PDZ domain-containing protein [Sphingomonas sp.]
MLLIGVLIAASVGASETGAYADPIARANGGELQSYRPNLEKKTCQSIASYRRTGLGTYLNTALLPLGEGVTLETHSPVSIKGGAVCGSITREDVLAGTLRVPNQVITPETAKPLLERVADAIGPIVGKEICTRYEPSGADFIAKSSIDGVYQPDKDTMVKWIAATDGYSVAETPRPYRTEVPISTPELEAKWMYWAKCGMANGGYGFSWVETSYGIYILAVAPGSRAEAAGLRRGQQVIEVNGKSTLRMSRNDFRTLIYSRPAAGFDLKFHDASDVRLPPL